ncbi:MAG: hypothetical protein IJK01_03305 [Clostridia bacterium]|nr:hypothetical protein [Clostridia bacterium]
MKRLGFGILLCALLLTGCQKEVSLSPEPTQEPIVIIAATDAPIAPAATESPALTASPSPTPAPTSEPTQQERLLSYIAGMTTEEKIGQMCMFGFSGTKSISSEFAEILRTYRIGSVILFGQGKNITNTPSDGGFSQCQKLTDSIRAASESEIPLLISTDVEGGSVTRFRWSKTLDSARTLGNKHNTTRARDQFARIGEGLIRAGINVDLAPVLDVAPDPTDHFLGKRIISSNEDIAAEIGIACIDGLHDANVLSVVKHFPGHGAVNTDSHDRTPVSYKSLDSLRAYDLYPFECAFQNGADGVMVGHLLFEAIDDEHIASQSYVFITELIREEFGFEGIVMSDDFRMAGLRKQVSLDQAAVQFVLAGGDLILCGAEHSYQRMILDGLYAAVADGTIPEERLNESVYRILSAKLRVTDWTV